MDRQDELTLYETIIGMVGLEKDDVDSLVSKLIVFINELLKAAHADGYNEGSDDGYNNGYDVGLKEGYDDGVLDAESNYDFDY